MKPIMLIAFLIMFSTASSALAGSSYSFQWRSFTANAGGQQAYAFKYAVDEREIGLFLNEYLLSRGQPIFGATYDFRYVLCGFKCPVQFYAHAGAGISTGGPLLQLGWSSHWLWIGRLDVMTQIFFERSRLINWSYPLWIGISVPLP
jgi:hypothetical protein